MENAPSAPLIQVCATIGPTPTSKMIDQAASQLFHPKLELLYLNNKRVAQLKKSLTHRSDDHGITMTLEQLKADLFLQTLDRAADSGLVHP